MRPAGQGPGAGGPGEHPAFPVTLALGEEGETNPGIKIALPF